MSFHDFTARSAAQRTSNSVVAGVAGARDEIDRVVDLDPQDFIPRGARIFAAEKRIKKLRRLRPLHGEPGVRIARICKSDLAAQVRLHPRKILVDLGRIHHEQVTRFTEPIDDEVVDHPTAFIVRRSMPWADACQAGLVFVAFGNSFDAFDALLRRMVGAEDGIVDALFTFTRPISGSYFWCPPMKNGRLDLRAVGL